jgi:hypothetical protein
MLLDRLTEAADSLNRFLELVGEDDPYAETAHEWLAMCGTE